MKIPDTVVSPQNPHPGSELYTSRESLRAFSQGHHSEVTNSTARMSRASDIVTLTQQARLNSQQTRSPAVMVSADQTATAVSGTQPQAPAPASSTGQSATDYQGKGGEAVVQLIEMLTGIKVKLLTQADLLEEDKKRKSDNAKVAEVQPQGDLPAAPPSPAIADGGSPVGQTSGTLKFADGKELSFTLDMALSKNDATSADLNRNGGTLSRNGVEIYLQKNRKELPPQDHLPQKASKVASDKESKPSEKVSSSGDSSARMMEKSVVLTNAAGSELPGGVAHAGMVVGRVTIGASPAVSGSHYFVSA